MPFCHVTEFRPFQDLETHSDPYDEALSFTLCLVPYIVCAISSLAALPSDRVHEQPEDDVVVLEQSLGNRRDTHPAAPRIR